LDKLGRTIGQGTFGKVVAAIDLETDKRVAVKIVRKDHADYEDAKLEAEILMQLQTISSGSENLCIRILEWFDYHGHLCLVFNLLGHSIYEFLRRNHYQPFPMKDVQKIAYQLCKAVKFCHDNGLAHTDLKPENILFVDSRLEITEHRNNYGRMRGEYRRIKNCDIRLIDFGSAVFEKDHNKGIVSTRQYRAPEVVLDEGWSFPCDVGVSVAFCLNFIPAAPCSRLMTVSNI
jgi:serine/threonine protein kinase